MTEEDQRKEKTSEETIRKYCEEQETVSAPLLQRKFKISYQEAKIFCDLFPEKSWGIAKLKED